MDHFTRYCEKEVPKPDWDKWRDILHTEGIVDKVKKNHDILRAQYYTIDKAVAKLDEAPSKESRALDHELTYQHLFYLDGYSNY